MDPQNLPQSQNPVQKIHNPLEVMQPEEHIICEIKRHPIGMLGMYLVTGVILIVFAVLALVIAPSILTSNRSTATAIGTVIFLLVACVIIGFVFIANKVYWGNSWVVSSDSLTQITQTSLFSKQSSQLSLGNLEDVTTEQHGILAQLFKFGTLRVETAGERSKFILPYTPTPNYYAQKILAAREAFEQAHHGGKQEPFTGAAGAQAPAPVFPDTPYDNRQNYPNQ
jgi:uncharacterized membrane protein YdbT with pleckstrin-like domain